MVLSTEQDEGDGDDDAGEMDPMFEEAIRIVAPAMQARVQMPSAGGRLASYAAPGGVGEWVCVEVDIETRMHITIELSKLSLVCTHTPPAAADAAAGAAAAAAVAAIEPSPRSSLPLAGLYSLAQNRSGCWVRPT